MSHSHASITCDVCEESFRSEAIINHYKREHPDYLCNCIIPLTIDETSGRIVLGHTAEMRKFIDTMNGAPTPFCVGLTNDEDADLLHVDFSNGHAYVKTQTAMKHVDKNADKHRNNWFKAVYDGLTPEKLVMILNYIRQKPVEVVNHTVVNDLKEKLKGMENSRNHWHSEWIKLNSEREGSQTNTIVTPDRTEELQREINRLKTALENAEYVITERMNMTRHRIDGEEIEYREQVKQQFEKFKKEFIKSSQKEWKAKEKKYKATIKKLKAAAIESDSDSDSDSD